MRCPHCNKSITANLNHDTTKAISAWHWVLERRDSARNLIPGEDITIARQIQEKGLEAVLLALKGSLVEPKTRDFDPGKFVSLRRIFDPRHFEKMVTLGAQLDAAKKKEEKRYYKAHKKVEQEEVKADPERVARIIRETFEQNEL